MKKLFFLGLLLFCISTANALNITDFHASPDAVEINESVEISAFVRSAEMLEKIELSITIPDNRLEIFHPEPFHEIIDYSLTLPIDYPPNITVFSKTYNFTIDCRDFTDNSNCYVLRYSIFENCVNITFDDQPFGGDRDLDIGVYACVAEDSSGYTIVFNRWMYDAGNDVRAMFCINSGYGTNFCSSWILNNTGCSSAVNCTVPQNTITRLNKTIFGGSYIQIFDNIILQGTYNLLFSAQDVLGNTETSTSYFTVGEIAPPFFKNWQVFPQESGILEKVIFSVEIFPPGLILNTSAIVSGSVNQTIELVRGEDNLYTLAYFPQLEGNYSVYVSATNIFGTQNQTELKHFFVTKPIKPPTQEACQNITSIGISSHALHVSPEKILALVQMNYYCTKNILGLWDYNFYMEITDLQGNYLELENTMLVYGLYPGKLNSFDALYDVDRNKLGGYRWASPNYILSSGVRALKNQIAADGNCTETGCEIIEECPPGQKYCINYPYALEICDKLLPETRKFKSSNNFNRIMLLYTGSELKLVKINLGIWN